NSASRYCTRENLAERNLVQRNGMAVRTGVFTLEARERTERAVFGNERVCNDNIFRAGALQAERVPVVDDFEIAARHHECAVIGRRIIRIRRYHAAEKYPLTMIATAGE